MVVALPLLALVTYSSLARYSDDRARAETNAANRALLFATLLGQAGETLPPSVTRLRGLLELSPLPEGSAITVLDGSEVSARTNPAAGPSVARDDVARAVERRTGDFTHTGTSGVERVWGLAPIEGTSLTVAFGLPAEAAYGAARSALWTNLALAFAALIAVLGAALVAGGRLTAPIRRLAATTGARGRADEVQTIEAELTRRADRIAALRAIDRALLDAGTPDEVAAAALGRLRRLLGADRAEVVLVEDGRERSPGVDGRAEGGTETAVPIEDGGTRLGEIRLISREPIGEDGMAAAAEVADQLAIGLRHARLNAELQAILDAAMDVVVVVDSDRRFVSVNDAACRFYERSREQLIGARLDELIGAERAERDWKEFLSEDRVAQGMLEDVWEGEQEGSARLLEVRSHPGFLPGRHLFVMRDITDRRRLEDQLRQAQKMEAVGQLAGGVAHDFNNLLTVIGGYGEIARRRIGAGPGATELLEVERAAERATQLTKQLLAFSRQQVLDPVQLDLSEIASGLVPMLRRLIGEDIEIAMLTDAGLPSVLADRAQVEQVLVNLAVNARDAMPTGGTLTIETRGVTLDDRYGEQHAGVEPGDYVCLTVTDTGIGMTDETLTHVFEPFFTTKDVGEGTGLGLATVHGIVNQSGGHILVYSEPSLGTSFKVYLPATGAPATGAAAGERGKLDRLGGSETILLCEDEGSVRQLIAHVLTAHGYRVLSTGGPHEAVERAVEHDQAIDALVSDVIMPDMSGPELARRLASVRPGLRTLFVSGYTAETVRERGRLPEGSAFLEKPFDQLSLLRAVRALLGQPARRPG